MAKKTRARAKAKWVKYTQAKYSKAIGELVHFSSKTVNSNALPCGIRLGGEDYVDLPYVAVSTMQPGSVPCDYFKGASGAGVIKQVADVLSGEPLSEKYESPPSEQELFFIHEASEQLRRAYAEGTRQVAIRLRQIIVQDGDGNDIALTPLQSAGLSHVLVSRIEDELAAQPEGQRRYRERGFLGLGGANPQNVGRYVRDMWRPLWFRPPQDHTDLRRALAIHYKGIRLAPPVRSIQEYHAWRSAVMAGNDGKMVSDADRRAKEADAIRAITAAIRSRADRARELLIEYLDDLPNKAITAEDLDKTMRALLDPEQRYRGWKRDFAVALRRKIIDFKLRIDGEWISMGIGDRESERWITIIEEAL